MFSDWAEPVVDMKWAIVCSVLSWLKKASSYRLFVSSSHRAWQKAVNYMDYCERCGVISPKAGRLHQPGCMRK